MVTVVVEVIGEVLDGPAVRIVAVVLSEQIRKNGNSDPNTVVVSGLMCFLISMTYRYHCGRWWCHMNRFHRLLGHHMVHSNKHLQSHSG